MNNRKKVRKSTAVALVVMLAVVLGWIVWGNTALEINEYRINSPKLPENFEKELMETGVHVLRDKEIILEKDGEQIALVGNWKQYYSS